MTRRGWAVGILVAWAASLGWLVKRELFRSTGARLAESALRVPPGAAYYRLEVGGQQLGFFSSTIDTVGKSIRVTEIIVFEEPALGVLHRTTAMSRATLSRALRLESVDARFSGDLGRFRARAAVSGDTALTMGLMADTDSETTRIPFRNPTLPVMMPLRLAFGGDLKPGRSYDISVYDPLLLEEHDLHVTVAAESTFVIPDSAAYDSTAMAWVPVHFDTLQAFEIEETGEGVPARAWIDAQGHVVRAENAVGFSLERSAFEVAYENFHHRDTLHAVMASATPGPGAVIPTTAIAARIALRAESLATFRVRLTGADLARLDLGRDLQRVTGDTVAIRRAGAAELAARYELPARDSGLGRVLAPEPLIQSEDARIRAAARAIVGSERDPARAARLLVEWVHGHLRPAVRTSAPSAVGALAAGRGDCNEYALLYVALARAVGLPARVAAGLVYLNGRFYYHAWPEVYLGPEDWVGVDPTLGEFPADAAHLRFGVGALARQVELARFIGRLKLEVL